MEGICRDLKERRHWISPVTGADRAAHREFLGRMSRMPEDAWQHLLRVTDACVGCEICQKVCPSGSIHMENGRAVHVPGNCQTCLACAHACPQKAIGLTIMPGTATSISGCRRLSRPTVRHPAETGAADNTGDSGRNMQNRDILTGKTRNDYGRQIPKRNENKTNGTPE